MAAILAAAVTAAACAPEAGVAPSDSSAAGTGTTSATLPLTASGDGAGGSQGEEAPEETVTGTSSRALGSFDNTRAMRHIRKLATDIGRRPKTSAGERRAAEYMKGKLEAYGYDAWFQNFSVDGGRSLNVVARWPGAIRYGFVIGGHIDTVPEAPGANDNASGVAVVLETARLAAGKPQARFLTFVGFGSEESGQAGTHHDGSRQFVGRLGPRGRNRLPGMISVDMIADGKPLLTGNSDIASDVVARALYRKIERNTRVAIRYQTLCDCSDHGPFEHAGIPASFMYSGNEPDYHSSSDTVPNMKPRHVLRTGKALRSFVEDVKRRMIDRFRRY